MGRKRFVDERQMSLPFEMEVETYCEAAKRILEHAKPEPTADYFGTDNEVQFNAGLQEACKDAIKRACMSRAQVLDIANAMFGRTGEPEKDTKRPKSLRMLDNYLSKPEVLIPCWILYAICAATHDLGPLEHLVAKLGGTVISPEERREMLLGKLDRNIRTGQRLKRELLQQMRRSSAAHTNTEDMDHGQEEQGEESGSGTAGKGNRGAKRSDGRA